MGQYSWIYSDTKKQVVDNRRADTYLLVPPSYQSKYGSAIYEPCYNGYGSFGSYDIYELVAEWNKTFIPELIKRIKSKEWVCSVNDEDVENLQHYYLGEPITCELRWLGIIMGCYDEDNFALPYPIKIT